VPMRDYCRGCRRKSSSSFLTLCLRRVYFKPGSIKLRGAGDLFHLKRPQSNRRMQNREVNPFKPDYRYPSLAEVPIEEFASRGIKGALLDLDNTLIPYGQYDSIPDFNLTWLARAKEAGVQCLLYSNATQRKIEKLQKISGLPGVPKVYKPAWKLLGKALDMLGCTKEQVILIGDQCCTDVLGGNLGGVETVLVEPLTGKDWIGTKLLRMIEWMVLPDRRPWGKRKRIDFD
jgi:HAD superfamily phosphatase (TIGR01668 family)